MKRERDMKKWRRKTRRMDGICKSKEKKRGNTGGGRKLRAETWNERNRKKAKRKK